MTDRIMGRHIATARNGSSIDRTNTKNAAMNSLGGNRVSSSFTLGTWLAVQYGLWQNGNLKMYVKEASSSKHWKCLIQDNVVSDFRLVLVGCG